MKSAANISISALTIAKKVLFSKIEIQNYQFLSKLHQKTKERLHDEYKKISDFLNIQFNLQIITGTFSHEIISSLFITRKCPTSNAALLNMDKSKISETVSILQARLLIELHNQNRNKETYKLFDKEESLTTICVLTMLVNTYSEILKSILTSYDCKNNYPSYKVDYFFSKHFPMRHIGMPASFEKLTTTEEPAKIALTSLFIAPEPKRKETTFPNKYSPSFENFMKAYDEARNVSPAKTLTIVILSNSYPFEKNYSSSLNYFYGSRGYGDKDNPNTITTKDYKDFDLLFKKTNNVHHIATSVLQRSYAYNPLNLKDTEEIPILFIKTSANKPLHLSEQDLEKLLILFNDVYAGKTNLLLQCQIDQDDEPSSIFVYAVLLLFYWDSIFKENAAAIIANNLLALMDFVNQKNPSCFKTKEQLTQAVDLATKLHEKQLASRAEPKLAVSSVLNQHSIFNRMFNTLSVLKEEQENSKCLIA